jgi:membrane fusion protein (multidrug efflux system)
MKSLSWKSLVFLLVGAGALAAGAWHFGYEYYYYVNTDNAQIGGHVVLVSSQASGMAVRVVVNENEHVTKGQVLAELDNSDVRKGVEEAEAQISALDARHGEAERGLARATELVASNVVSREQLERAQASYKELDSRMKEAHARLEAAELKLKRSQVLAPEDGWIARKSVETGQYVVAGQPIFGFVSAPERWVIANLKETELPGVVPGVHAWVTVDAIPGERFEGTVDSISPSTGAIFTLLPPDNAAGNFTKVVQRVPIRIKLANLSDRDVERLRPGLSAQVRIKVR